MLVSWDDDIPNLSGKTKIHVPNHQPDMLYCNVGKAIIGHPPFITTFMGGIPTINSMGGLLVLIMINDND